MKNTTPASPAPKGFEASIPNGRKFAPDWIYKSEVRYKITADVETFETVEFVDDRVAFTSYIEALQVDTRYGGTFPWFRVTIYRRLYHGRENTTTDEIMFDFLMFSNNWWEGSKTVLRSHPGLFPMVAMFNIGNTAEEEGD